MTYIGNNLTVQQYSPQIAYFSGNGTATSFTLPSAVVSSAQIIVSVANVVQNPSSAFTVSGTTLTFTSAPPSGTNNIWVEYTSLTTAISVPPSGYSEFASGTQILFQQSAAPTYWTKVTTYSNHALRIVSGSTSSGGSVPFTTAFTSQSVSGSVSTSISSISGNIGISGSVDQTTLSGGQIPNHNHTGGGYETIYVTANQGSPSAPFNGNSGGYYGGYYAPSYGGSGSHNHSVGGVSGSFSYTGGSASSSFSGNSINLAVNYVDAIICTKN